MSQTPLALAPPFQQRRQLLLQKLKEFKGFRHPRARWSIAPENLYPLAQAALPAGEHLVAPRDGLVPNVVMYSVVIAPGPGLTFAARQVDLSEIAHRTRNGGRTHLQQVGQVSRCEPS